MLNREEQQGEGNRRRTAGNVGDREYVLEMHLFPCTAFPPRSLEGMAGNLCNREGTAGNTCNGQGTCCIGTAISCSWLIHGVMKKGGL